MSFSDPPAWPGVADLPEGPPETPAPPLAPPPGPPPTGFPPAGSGPLSTPPWQQPLPGQPTPYGSKPYGSTPGGPPPPDRRKAWIAAAVVGAVLVLVAAVVIGYRWGRPADTAAPAPTTSTPTPTPTSTTTSPSSSASPSTTPPSSAPTTTVPASGGISKAELDATVADIETFVEAERGLTYKQPVAVKVLDDQDFTQKLLSTETEKDRQDEAKVGDTLKALGLVEPDVDFVDILHKALSGGVIGFYDDETKELYVRGTELGPYERTTLAHELTHALDDQYFNLDRKQYDDDKGEIGFGFSALTEGNARRVENAYIAQLSTADRRAYDKSESLIGNNGELANIPDVVGQMLGAPYDLGEPFVEALLQNGGQPALDKAFANPPVSSEQVINPAKYASGEAPVKVDPPPVEGTTENDGVLGELTTLLVLEPVVGQRAAVRAADGWGGDWSVLYDAGNQKCIRTDYVMDTANDLQELQQAYQQWASSGASGRTVETPAAGKLRVTSCVQK